MRIYRQIGASLLFLIASQVGLMGGVQLHLSHPHSIAICRYNGIEKRFLTEKETPSVATCKIKEEGPIEGSMRRLGLDALLFVVLFLQGRRLLQKREKNTSVEEV